jgi:hypothetical protein
MYNYLTFNSSKNMDIFSKIKNTLSKIFPPKADQPRAGKNTLKNILKNKKAMVFAFLFLVIFNFIIPSIANAGWHPACWEWAWGKPTAGTYRGDLCHYSDENTNAVLNAIDDPVKIFASGLILAILMFTITVVGALATLAGTMLTNVMGAASGAVCYTCFSNPVIQFGWPIVRDLANMMVVLGFIIIALATIIRYKDYEAKKLLPKLIIAALLINFSLVICGVFIDASNITITQFMKGGTGGGFLEKSATDNVGGQLDSILLSWDLKNTSNAIGKAVAATFYDTMLFVVFMLFFFLFLFRYLMLWILVMLSPLAFVCYVFPITKSYFTMWWNNFLQWCIIGIPAAFFTFIAGKMMEGFLSSSAPATTGLEVVGKIVPALFMVAGFLFSLKTSAMGASIVTTKAGQYFNKGKGMLGGAAMGAAKSSAKTLADISGAQRLALASKDAMTRTGEAFGLVKRGTTAENRRGRLTDKTIAEDVNRMTDEQKANYANANHVGKRASIMRAAIVKDLASKNKLGLLNDQDGRVREALRNGVRYSEVVGGMDSSRIANAINNNQGDAETRTEGFKALMKRGALDLIQVQGGTAAQTQALRTRIAGEAMAHGVRPEDAERVDYHYGATNEARLDRIAQANFGGSYNTRPAADQATIRGNAEEQALDENWKKMSPEQRQNVEIGRWTPARIDRLEVGDVDGLRFASQPIRDTLRTSANAGGQLQIDEDLATQRAVVWGTNGRGAITTIGGRDIPPGDANQSQVDYYTKEANRLASLRRAIGRLP